jgi:uncharacterized protein (TIGR00369 family)
VGYVERITTMNDMSQNVVIADVIKGMSGLEFLQAIMDGRLPMPPIGLTLGFRPTAASKGFVSFEGTPARSHYNPIGTVHGGYAATLLDSCMGCAVHSTLDRGIGYTTLEFKVSFVRAITAETGLVRADGSVLHSGRRVATAEGQLVDRDGRLLATGTTTCLVMPL